MSCTAEMIQYVAVTSGSPNGGTSIAPMSHLMRKIYNCLVTWKLYPGTESKDLIALHSICSM